MVVGPYRLPDIVQFSVILVCHDL